MASSHAGDPYWTTARFAGQSANRDGAQIKRGDRIFYYPRERKSYVGAEAEAASADFTACVADEDFCNGGNY